MVDLLSFIHLSHKQHLNIHCVLDMLSTGCEHTAGTILQGALLWPSGHVCWRCAHGPVSTSSHAGSHPPGGAVLLTNA